MRQESDLAGFPETLRISTEKMGTYRRVPRHFAVHGAWPESSEPEPPGVRVVGRLEAEDVTFVSSEGEMPELPSTAPTPVYATSQGGPLAMPTGEVFVRLAPSLKVKDFVVPMAGAGYEVTKTLVYAPQAAWLKARSGSTAEALRHIPNLEALPEVENVEPQMLAIRTHR